MCPILAWVEKCQDWGLRNYFMNHSLFVPVSQFVLLVILTIMSVCISAVEKSEQSEQPFWMSFLDIYDHHYTLYDCHSSPMSNYSFFTALIKLLLSPDNVTESWVFTPSLTKADSSQRPVAAIYVSRPCRLVKGYNTITL